MIQIQLQSSSRLDIYSGFIHKMNQVIFQEQRLFSYYCLFAQIVSGIHRAGLSERFMMHASHELAHAQQVAHRIEQLGGSPLYPTKGWFEMAQATPCCGKSYDLKGMLRELIQEEHEMIYLYRELLLLSDASDVITHQLLQAILKEDKQHESDLSNYIHEIDRTNDRLTKEAVYYDCH